MVLFNEKGEVALDTEGYMDRLNANMELIQTRQLHNAPPARVFTAADIAAVKAAPVMMVIDSCGEMP
jgi:hypothetical protein